MPFKVRLEWIDGVCMTGPLLKNAAYGHRIVGFYRLHSQYPIMQNYMQEKYGR